jgi:hypothetical protein
LRALLHLVDEGSVPQVAISREKPGTPPSQPPGGLLALAQSGRHYEFLNAGYQLLAPTPAVTKADADRSHDSPDAGLVVLMIRSLALLGLGGPARELLLHAKHIGLALDFDALRTMLVPLPIGRVPWNELAPQYQSNRAALLQAQPDLADALRLVESAARAAQLFRTADDTYLLSHARPNELREWTPGLIEPAVFAGVPIAKPEGGRPMLVVGVGASAMLQRVIDETTTPPHEPGVLLLVADDDAARVFATLHTIDLAPLLAQGRLRLFLGGNAPAQLADFLATNADVDLPAATVISQWARALNEKFAPVIGDERARRDAEFKSIVPTLRSRAEQRTMRDHAERLAPGATIVGFTSRFTTMLQYSMRDIGSALAEDGYNFVLVREEDAQRTHSSLTIARAVEEHDPALVVMINHFRRDRAQSMIGVPALTWIQDPTPVVLSRATGASLTPLDFVCGYYITECTGQFSYPTERFFSVCLPVSSYIFHDAPLRGDDEEQFACDVMYVGHRHADACAHVETWRESTPAELRPLLERLRTDIEQLVEQGEPLVDPAQLVRRVADETNPGLTPTHIDQFANYFLTRLHDILYRAQTLRWVARWAQRTHRSFRLYGMGWSDDAELAPFAVGPVEHGEQLRRAYRGARIVLQTLPAGFMHQRTFEGLASGSLVLARHAPTSSAADYFPGIDRVIFDCEATLLDLLDGYLGNDALRVNVTAELRGVVMRELTYSAIMPRVIARIRDGLRSSS